MQACVTKWFKPMDPAKHAQYHEWLFEKEKMDRQKKQEEREARIKATNRRRKKERDRLRKIQREKEKVRKEAERLRREEEARKRAELTRRKLEGQEIVPGLFVGGRLAASNPDWISLAISQSKLSAVLNCTPNVRNFFDFSATDSQSAEADDDGQRELAELESLISTETQDITEEAKDESTATEGQNDSNKVDAKKLVDLLTQEPDMPLVPISSDGQEAVPTTNGDAQLVTQQPMTGEEVFFATLETMTDDAKLAILESIALPGDEPDAEALRIKQEEEEADRKSAEMVKETESLIQRSKQRLTNAQQSAVSLNIKLTYERIAIDDNGGIELATWFEKAAAFIGEVRSRGEAVLVHCREGRSRSVTMCVAYMMIGMKMTLKDAMERIHEAVFDENVNTGFKRQLMDLDFDLHGSNSIDFHNRRSRAAKLNAPSSYAEGPSEPRKSKRTRTTRKATSAKSAAASQASNGSNGGDGDEDDDYAPDEQSFIPPSKIKAIRLVMTPPSSQTSSIGMDEDEKESENNPAPTFSSANPELTSNASKPRQHVDNAAASHTTASEPVITVTKAKTNEMEVDESEIVDIDSPPAPSASSTSNESKMQVDDNQADKKPQSEVSATSLDVPSKPKAKPTSAPSTPKKSAKASAATSATAKATASPSKAAGGAKKKTAAPTPQKNTLFNYFGAKKTEE